MSVLLLSTKKNAVNDVSFVAYNKKERVHDVRFVAFNEKERVHDVILAKMHVAKCFSW